MLHFRSGANRLSWMNDKQACLLKFSFLIAAVATAGSLFFSEVMKLPPCVLCWYQRICMYPLVLILGLALTSQTKDVFKYTLLLSGFGLLIAIYHNLLYYSIIPDSITPCTEGISCTSKQLEWLGFITIPLMSLVSFVILLFTSLSALKLKGETDEK
jgi:disulfide bond formation protein DsbB